MTTTVNSSTSLAPPVSTTHVVLETPYKRIIKEVDRCHFLYAEKLIEKLVDSSEKHKALSYLNRVKLAGASVHPEDTTSKVQQAAAGKSSAPLATPKAKSNELSDQELYAQVLKYNKTKIGTAYGYAYKIQDEALSKKAFSMIATNGRVLLTESEMQTLNAGGSGGAPALPAPITSSVTDVATATAAAGTSTLTRSPSVSLKMLAARAGSLKMQYEQALSASKKTLEQLETESTMRMMMEKVPSPSVATEQTRSSVSFYRSQTKGHLIQYYK